MNVELAKTAGFCFGVKRAVETVYEQVEKHSGEKIYTYGPIIHNEEVIKDMASHGVGVLNSLEELKELTEGIVIIRSHGVPKFFMIFWRTWNWLCRCHLFLCEENP